MLFDIERADEVKRGRMGLPEGAQLALIDEPAVVAGGEGEAAAPVKRGRGRPKGAVNKDTAEMREYLASLGYRSGLIALAELGGGASLDELIDRALHIRERTRCTIEFALKLVFDAAREFTSYQASKPAAAPAARDTGSVTIVQVTQDRVDQAGGDLRIAVMVSSGEQNQALSDDRAVELDARELDGSQEN